MATAFLFQHENAEDILFILLISTANDEAALAMKLPIYKKQERIFVKHFKEASLKTSSTVCLFVCFFTGL